MSKIKHSEYYRSLSDIKEWRFIKDVKTLILMAEHRMRKHKLKEFCIVRNKAVGAMMYLSAGRVLEVNDLYIKDLKIYENRLHVQYMSMDLPNRKNRKQRHKRNIANFKNEKFFIDCIYTYYRLLIKMTNPEINVKKLIYGKYEITPEIADILNRPLWVTIVNKKLKVDSLRRLFYNFYHINSHTFRKIRLTHLVIHYNMSAKEVQNFAGHSSVVSSEPYINITNKDFEAKMDFIAR